MQYFYVLVPFLDKDFVLDGNVDLHLLSFVKELRFLKFLPYLRKGQLNQKVFGNGLNLVGYLP